MGSAPVTEFEKGKKKKKRENGSGMQSWVHVVAVVLCIWYFSQYLTLSQYVCHQPGAAINLL